MPISPVDTTWQDGGTQVRTQLPLRLCWAITKSPTGSLPPAVPLAITPTSRPWTHTSDDNYIYQLSLVLATATVSLVRAAVARQARMVHTINLRPRCIAQRNQKRGIVNRLDFACSRSRTRTIILPAFRTTPCIYCSYAKFPTPSHTPAARYASLLHVSIVIFSSRFTHEPIIRS